MSFAGGMPSGKMNQNRLTEFLIVSRLSEEGGGGKSSKPTTREVNLGGKFKSHLLMGGSNTTRQKIQGIAVIKAQSTEKRGGKERKLRQDFHQRVFL